MFIQTEQTPNPATLKFIPGQPVMMTGTAEFKCREDAVRSPLAQRLFEVAGVQAVFFGADFISVTKAPEVEWDRMRTSVLAAIMEHYTSGFPVIEGAAEALPGGGDDDPLVLQIKELLETRVRPAVAQDGGDIEFHGFEKGVVYLRMRGACSGCPSSTATLKMGIENMLRHYVPEVIEVRPVQE